MLFNFPQSISLSSLRLCHFKQALVKRFSCAVGRLAKKRRTFRLFSFPTYCMAGNPSTFAHTHFECFASTARTTVILRRHLGFEQDTALLHLQCPVRLL